MHRNDFQWDYLSCMLHAWKHFGIDIVWLKWHLNTICTHICGVKTKCIENHLPNENLADSKEMNTIYVKWINKPKKIENSCDVNVDWVVLAAIYNHIQIHFLSIKLKCIKWIWISLMIIYIRFGTFPLNIVNTLFVS